MFSNFQYIENLKMAYWDSLAENAARQICSSEWRKPDWKPKFDEEMSIRHHKMTIALAMPDRIRGKS